MATRGSEWEQDQRDKAGKENSKSTDQPAANDTDETSRTPNRVHIFKGKSPSGGPSKSAGEPLRCSSFGTDGPIGWAGGASQATVSSGFQPRIIGLHEALMRLNDEIQLGKQALYEAAMKAEDLEVITQGLEWIRQRIFKKRK